MSQSNVTLCPAAAVSPSQKSDIVEMCLAKSPCPLTIASVIVVMVVISAEMGSLGSINRLRLPVSSSVTSSTLIAKISIIFGCVANGASTLLMKPVVSVSNIII